MFEWSSWVFDSMNSHIVFGAPKTPRGWSPCAVAVAESRSLDPQSFQWDHWFRCRCHWRLAKSGDPITNPLNSRGRLVKYYHLCWEIFDLRWDFVWLRRKCSLPFRYEQRGFSTGDRETEREKKKKKKWGMIWRRKKGGEEDG